MPVPTDADTTATTSDAASPVFSVTGTARLAAWIGALLTVAVALQLWTVLSGVGPLRDVHVAVGLSLVVLVVAKLVPVGFRFLQYYRREPRFHAAGAPPLLPRILAPALVLATFVLLSTGVVMVVDPGKTMDVIELHEASYYAFLALVVVHLLLRALPLAKSFASELSDARTVGRAPAVRAATAIGVAALAVVAALTGPVLLGG